MPRSSTTPERILSFQNASVLCPCYVFIFLQDYKIKGTIRVLQEWMYSHPFTILLGKEYRSHGFVKKYS